MGTSYNPSIVKNGLVLYLDAGNKKSYSGTGNTWYDLSTRKNHCTLQNGTAAYNNGGIYFDMSTFWRGTDGGFNSSTNSSTQIVWARPATVTSNKVMFYYGTSALNQSRGLEILATSNYRFWGFQNDLDSTLPMSLNVWNMAVGVYNNESPKQFTYLNNKIGATASFTWNTVSNGYYYVGADTSYAVGSRAWHGNIAIVMTYNRALSYAEIVQTYTATKGRFGLI